MTDVRTIPGFSRYTITPDGVVTETNTGYQPRPRPHARSGTVTITLKSDQWKWLSPALARLILHTYRPLKEPWMDAYAYVVYRDGCKDNCTLPNLDWDFQNYRPPFTPGVDEPLETFAPIPGYKRYEINALGHIRDVHSGRVKTGFLIDDGRYLATDLLTDDRKIVRLSIHRLLALTFLEHPVDTEHLVVNHKNGKKLDNSLSNLEWTTYAGNNDHAIETGLRSGTIRILTKSVTTGKIMEHRSIGACARFLGTSPQTIHTWLEWPDIRPYNGYFVKRGDDTRDWPKPGSTFRRAKNAPIPLIAEEVVSGTIHRFPSVKAAAEALGMKVGSVQFQLTRKRPGVYQGYRFTIDAAAAAAGTSRRRLKSSCHTLGS